jgi:hypothetical protein
MQFLSLVSVDYWLQQLRLRWHFVRVEGELRRRDTSRLPEDQKAKRMSLLDHLRSYGQHGVFPINTKYVRKTPIFVDDGGRRCAVAHLMDVSGHTHLVDIVSSQANTAAVPEMTFPQLDRWAAEHGFTRAELARIQPMYALLIFDYAFNTTILWASLMALVAGYFSLARRWQARRPVRILAAVGALITGISLFNSTYWLNFDLNRMGQDLTGIPCKQRDWSAQIKECPPLDTYPTSGIGQPNYEFNVTLYYAVPLARFGPSFQATFASITYGRTGPLIPNNPGALALWVYIPIAFAAAVGLLILGLVKLLVELRRFFRERSQPAPARTTTDRFSGLSPARSFHRTAGDGRLRGLHNP